MADYGLLNNIQCAVAGINKLKNFAGSILDGIGSGISNAYTNMTQNNTYNLNSEEQLAIAIRGQGYFYP